MRTCSCWGLAFEVLGRAEGAGASRGHLARAAHRVQPSAFNFLYGVMYDHREVVLKMTNKHDLLQVRPRPSRPLCASPSSGVVPAPAEVTVSFRPHQVGPLSGIMKLLP